MNKLARLTSEWKWELKVTLVDWDGRKYTALFHNFRVGHGPRYELVLGEFDQNVSNIGAMSFLFHNGQAFSTFDKDQDAHMGADCSKLSGHGGWWFKNCFRSNLNGRNIPVRYHNVQANNKNDDGITTIDERSRLTSYRETKMEMRKIKL